MVTFLDIYNRISKLPFGRFLFNKGVGLVAPFFGKIHPNIIELRPTICVVRMKDRWGIRNHIGSINAGALCTLAELTAGMAVDATIPNDLRWIPKGMTVSYLCKAKGTLESICRVEKSSLLVGEVIVSVVINNAKSKAVFNAEITFHISRKKHKS